MTVIGRLLERRSIENPSVPLTAHNITEFLDAGHTNDAGVTVTEDSALGLSAWWRASNFISGTCASLPLKTYKRGTKERAVVRLLDNPHPDKTTFELWELAYGSVCNWGNAYFWKVRNPAGMLTWLEPIHAGSVKVGKVKPTEAVPSGKVFEVTNDDGSKTPATPYEILHIPGFGYDGLTGCSPVRMARQAIANGIATEQYAGRLWGNGSLMAGILQTEQRLEQKDAEKIKARWQASVGGVGKSHEIAVLGSGAKFQPVTMPNSDAQFIESRRFNIAEVGRWFGLPGHFLGDTEKSTTWGSGIEHMSIGTVVFTLRPTWLTRFEQRVTKELTPSSVYAEYAVEGLLRGDSASRAAFYNTMFQIGAYSTNHILGLENLPPVEGGDVRYVPLNMAAVGPDGVPILPAQPEPSAVTAEPGEPDPSSPA